MAEPFDHRDVTFPGGGPRAIAETHFDTTLLNANVIKDVRVVMKVVDVRLARDCTEHEVRLYDSAGAPDNDWRARIAWRRDATAPEVVLILDERNEVDNFDAAVPSSNPDFHDVVNVGGGTLVVDSWVATVGAWTKQVTPSGGDVTFAIKSGSTVIFKAKLKAASLLA